MSTTAVDGARAGEVCPPRSVLRFDNALRGLFYSPARMFGPYVGPGMTALDVGCGAGFNCLGLARLVGERGRVIAADVQPELLSVVESRARRAGLWGRIQTYLCGAADIGVGGPVDFVDAFWMIHETPYIKEFLRQLLACLRPGGHLFVAEPLFHVSSGEFARLIATAEGLGLVAVARPRVWFSRAAIFRKGEGPRDA